MDSYVRGRRSNGVTDRLAHLFGNRDAAGPARRRAFGGASRQGSGTRRRRPRTGRGRGAHSPGLIARPALDPGGSSRHQRWSRPEGRPRSPRPNGRVDAARSGRRHIERDCAGHSALHGVSRRRDRVGSRAHCERLGYRALPTRHRDDRRRDRVSSRAHCERLGYRALPTRHRDDRRRDRVSSRAHCQRLGYRALPTRHRDDRRRDRVSSRAHCQRLGYRALPTRHRDDRRRDRVSSRGGRHRPSGRGPARR
jgi:hypothetical protein